MMGPSRIPLSTSSACNTNSGRGEGSGSSKEGCICDRKISSIFCPDCGYLLENDLEHHKHVRVYRICPGHPRHVPYTDLKCCPKCKSKNIEEEEFVDE